MPSNSTSDNWAIVDVELPYDPAWVNLDEPLESQFPPGPYLDAVRRALGKYPMPSLVVNP